ncbi:MAG: hypothetical protein WC613_01155 [Candidatus Aenigmatarchaeota archaeon]
MNYVKKTWSNLPLWSKVTLSATLAWGLMVNGGNALVAKRELDKGYTPQEADEQIRSRFGQLYPRWYDQTTYATGTLGRKVVYAAFD